jgi:hypothetical protein
MEGNPDVTNCEVMLASLKAEGLGYYAGTDRAFQVIHISPKLRDRIDIQNRMKFSARLNIIKKEILSAIIPIYTITILSISHHKVAHLIILGIDTVWDIRS